MSEAPQKANEPLPLSQALRVDKVRDRFENAWKAEQRPRIEDYLGDVPDPEQPELLRKLLGLEIGYRRQNSDTLYVEDYRRAFRPMPA